MDTFYESNRLNALKTYDILDSFSQKEFDDITFLASTLCSVPVAIISFIDSERQWFKSKTGTDVTETPREYSFCSHAILDPSHSLVVPDLRLDERFRNNPLVTGEPNVVFYAGAPLVTREGFGLGTVCVIDLKPRELTPTQLDCLKILANQVMQLLEARKEGTESRRKVEADFGIALELAALATWQIDLETNTVYYSRRLQEWLGVETVSAPFHLSFDGVYAEDREKISDAFKNALQPGSTGIFEVEYSLLHQVSGVRRIIRSHGQTIFDQNGIPKSIGGTAQDVTKMREVELALQIQVDERTAELQSTNKEIRAANEELNANIEQLEQSNLRLEKSNEQLAQYAYVASHDLQEPLRKIRIFSSMLSEDKTSPDQSILIDKVSETAERMTRLINDLLSFSKVLVKEENLVPVHLDKIVSTVLDEYDLIIREKNARIIVGGLPSVRGLEPQMEQLFSNLIGNALKFTERHRVPEIEIKAYPCAEPDKKKLLSNYQEGIEYVQIEICDNGIGFPEHQEDRIFEVFKRLNDRSAYSGSGIGLALCRRIVENHHGYIYGRGFPGKGSAFYIVLPGILRPPPIALPVPEPGGASA